MRQKQIATYVTVKGFQYYWQRQNERISSSFSGLHMGHHKASSYNKDLALLHAAKQTLCARMGVPLDRWGFEVTVLLEKSCGNNYVDRLWAICLFEADFNWWNNLVFAQQMMSQAGDSNLIPNKLFAKRGSQTMDTGLSKSF